MKLSSYFRDLNSAYQAELDDLTSDSEGKDVLRRRLQDKRREMGFLVQMIDISPEMVAVVFHQAFRFRGAAATFEPVFRLRDSFELPDWHSLASAVALEPWAEPLAAVACRVQAAMRTKHKTTTATPTAKTTTTTSTTR